MNDYDGEFLFGVPLLVIVVLVCLWAGSAPPSDPDLMACDYDAASCP
jgi:hypothetical protein